MTGDVAAATGAILWRMLGTRASASCTVYVSTDLTSALAIVLSFSARRRSRETKR